MDRGEFSHIRRRLGKTQSQMAQLIGTSMKAVQNFEQGWRKIPLHIERQVLFLLAQKNAREKGHEPPLCSALTATKSDDLEEATHVKNNQLP